MKENGPKFWAFENREATYLVPHVWVGFLVDLYFADLGRIRHFPLAIRVRVDPNILTHSFISNIIIGSIRQVKNERFLANIPVERARVEWISGVIGFAIPIQEGSRRRLHVSGQEDTPDYLNRIPPRNGYGPNPSFVIANGLLHKGIRVKFYRVLELLQGLDLGHIWKYGLNQVQVMEGY